MPQPNIPTLIVQGVNTEPYWLCEESGLSKWAYPLSVLEGKATFSEMLEAQGKAHDEQTAFLKKCSTQVASFLDDTYDPEQVERPYTMDGGVVIIPFKGVMQKEASWYDSYRGVASTQRFEAMCDFAIADPAKPKDVLIRGDSPGGNVDGTAQAADAMLRMIAAGITVTVLVDGTCCSAFYWLASYANGGIYASTVNDTIGSIGVLTAVADNSGILEAIGIKVYKCATGPLKGIGAFYSEVTKDQVKYIQAQVDKTGKEFARVVSTNRSIAVTMGEGVATGGTFRADEALGLGLIDGVASYNTVLDSLKKGESLKKSGATALNTQTQEGEGDSMPTTAETKNILTTALDDFAVRFGFKEKEAEQAKEEVTAETPVTYTEVQMSEVTTKLNGLQSAYDAIAKVAPDGATAESIAKLVEDGLVGRTAAYAEMASQMNRAAGKVGFYTPEKVAERMSTVPLAEINKEIEPFRAQGDKAFDQNPGKEEKVVTGRTTADTSSTQTQEATETPEQKKRKADIEANIAARFARSN